MLSERPQCGQLDGLTTTRSAICHTGFVARLYIKRSPLNAAPEPARVSCASVTFEPGARSAWHTHPLGQTLVVTAGCGWTQCEGGPIVEIRAGDVIWCPPNHKHWHGSMPTTSMTHVAIQEALNGKVVEWMEYVTDAEYLRGLS